MSALTTTLLSLVKPERIQEYLAAKGLPKTEDPEAGLRLLLRGVNSQRALAALTVNLTQGKIDGKTMTSVIAKGFPDADVGDRHGPYYLSQCRTGKIVTDFSPAKGGKAAATTEPAPRQVIEIPDPKTPILEARVKELEDRLLADQETINELQATLDLVRECGSIRQVRELLAAPKATEVETEKEETTVEPTPVEPTAT